jgi:CRISPR/Cas system-associated exonuclease Cas4 (RecB family)
MTPWLIVLATLVVGLLLILSGRGMRRSRGLGEGRTVELDDRNLYSRRYGLAGRPDRIIAGGIPEEWKSARRVYDSHRAQMGVYFILIEEETGVRPPHGFIVTGDGQRHRIDNTEDLRAWVLDVADQIRAARRQVAEIIHVNPRPGQCRACGQRGNCGQARV